MIVLYKLFESTAQWRALFSQGSPIAQLICAWSERPELRMACPPMCTGASCTGRVFDELREAWRDRMSALYPDVLPRRGPNAVSVDKLADATLFSDMYYSLPLYPAAICDSPGCEFRLEPEDASRVWRFPSDVNTTQTIDISSQAPTHLDDYIRRRLMGPLPRLSNDTHALQCDGRAFTQAYARNAPAILHLNGCYLNPDAVVVSPSFLLPVADGAVRYSLGAVVYHGMAHFTCRFSFQGSWWVYDGAEVGGHAVYEGPYANCVHDSRRFESLNGRRALKFVYFLDG